MIKSRNVMKKTILYVAGLLWIMATACFNDKGSYNYHDICEVTIDGLEASYNVSMGVSVLEIDPTVQVTIGDADDTTRFQYEWRATIPYDTGWTVTVDGEVVTPEKFGDAFIALPLTTGSHTLTFSYLPDGITEGTILTFSSLAILIALYLITLFWNRHKKHHAQKEFDSTNSEELFLPDDAEEDAVDRHHVEEVLREKRTGELPSSEELMSGHPLTESELSTSLQEHLGKIFTENTTTTQLPHANVQTTRLSFHLILLQIHQSHWIIQL